MRAREMHPLCCISVDCSVGAGGRSPEAGEAGWPPADEGGGGEVVAVAGVLYKWTNIGKGWRTRWFSLRNGVLSYSRIRRREAAPLLAAGEADGVRLIGTASSRLSAASAGEGGGGGEVRKPPMPPPKPIGVVHLKISSIRESKSDERRFYITSPTKKLRLRTDSKKDRLAWIEALVSARSGFSLDGTMSAIPNDASFSTERLRDRMRVEGLSEALIRDCEQIMRSEFSDFRRQLRLHFEERLSVIGTIQQQLEESNATEATKTIHEGHLQLMKHECSCSGHGKYSEYSTTESSDEVERRELDELSDDEEPYFFDSKEKFGDSTVISDSEISGIDPVQKCYRVENYSSASEMMDIEAEEYNDHSLIMRIERRKKLPDPIEKEKSVSLWSMIKDNVGKDLTRVCLPVYFNEPLSSLQKCFEDLEYSYLLDRAHEYGKMGNSLMRILNVAAFAVSGYASSEGRLCKPFNPLLGETYEADYPEKGIRFFSEKVSHHPMLIACHCEGKGWKFWGDSNLRSKFWGQAIQLDPVGVLTLEFDDGEIFQWSKVTTTIYNLILGKVYCNHHGTMNIRGNRQHSCKLKFKEQSILDRNPGHVQGFVEDALGCKVATLLGKWDDSMYYNICGDFSKNIYSKSTESATLLWKRNKPLPNATRYNLSSFAITLNELTPELQENLPPTDSRFRPDQRYLENGEYEKANAEKLRLEKRQRMSTKLQENGWKPRWFHRDSEDGTYRYIGGYWEAREQKKWDGCLDIFGEFADDLNVTRFK